MLESPISIRNLSLMNRLVMAPVDFELSDHGTVSDRQLSYYKERTCSGDVGLVVVEHAYVQADGRATENQLSVAKDEDIPGLTTLAQTIHEHGSKAMMQLSHAGAAIKKEQVITEGISPSGIANPNGAAGGGTLQQTHAMNAAEIQQLIDSFAAAALRAQKAGFDGVEIHSAHGYLLNQFYSPITNHRTDAYTGSALEGRLRIQLGILHAVKAALSTDMIVGIRLGGCDYMPGGTTIEDSVQASALLEQAGFDYISVSGGLCGARPANRTEPGYFKAISHAIKEVVHIPVIVTGGITKRAEAEMLLKAKDADMVGVARAIIQNPKWAEMAME